MKLKLLHYGVSLAIADFCAPVCLDLFHVCSLQNGDNIHDWELCTAFALSVILNKTGTFSDEVTLAQEIGTI